MSALMEAKAKGEVTGVYGRLGVWRDFGGVAGKDREEGGVDGDSSSFEMTMHLSPL